MTHSPAPWTSYEHDPCEDDRFNDCDIYDSTGKRLAAINKEEDAALILAAPDLLAAAKEAAKQLEWSYDVETLKDKDSIAALKQLKAAISKAEPNEI